MNDLSRILLQLAVASLAAACVAEKAAEPADPRTGDVAVKKLQAAETDRYQEPGSDEKYDYPVQFDENAPPAYPETLLAQRLPPLRVKVRLIVDETGIVTGCEPLDAGSDRDPAFLAAVRTAVLAWKFTPLVRIASGPGRTDIIFQGVVMTFEGQATALPFHQDYEFTFTQRDGKGFVSSQAPGQPQ